MATLNQLYSEIDRKAEALRVHFEQCGDQIEDFWERLDLSWIYHDNALEGVVLSFYELNAAIDPLIISDVSLIPTYDDVQNHKEAIGYVRQMAKKRKSVVGLEYLKKLHLILSQEHSPRPGKAPPKPTPGQYRKDNPLHRMYFHEIAPPDKISYQMRKAVAWVESEEAKKLHPVRRAATAHQKLIAIFPWPRHSGKVARLLMNGMLIHDGYLPSIVHAIERQRYYEVLRQPPEALATLIAEGLLRTQGSALQYFENPEFAGVPG